MQRFFCAVGNERLECMALDIGRRRGPVLVFLHEGLGCAEGWKAFPSWLADATGLAALVYSRAGYGRSSGVVLPRSVSYMHDEALKSLPRLLDELGIDDAILFGHSDGASIALIHAGARLDARIRALVLEAPHVMIEDVTVSSIRQLDLQYRSGGLRERLARYHADNVECAFRGFTDTWLDPVNARDWNILDYVAAVQVPVLLIQGRDDRFGTPRQVASIVDAVGGPIEAHLIPGCEHHPHLEKGEWVLDRACRFIAGVMGKAKAGVVEEEEKMPY